MVCGSAYTARSNKNTAFAKIASTLPCVEPWATVQSSRRTMHHYTSLTTTEAAAGAAAAVAAASVACSQAPGVGVGVGVGVRVRSRGWGRG